MTQFILVSHLFSYTWNTLMLYLHISISNYNFSDTFKDTEASHILVKFHFFSEAFHNNLNEGCISPSPLIAF